MTPATASAAYSTSTHAPSARVVTVSSARSRASIVSASSSTPVVIAVDPAIALSTTSRTIGRSETIAV